MNSPGTNGALIWISGANLNPIHELAELVGDIHSPLTAGLQLRAFSRMCLTHASALVACHFELNTNSTPRIHGFAHELPAELLREQLREYGSKAGGIDGQHKQTSARKHVPNNRAALFINLPLVQGCSLTALQQVDTTRAVGVLPTRTGRELARAIDAIVTHGTDAAVLAPRINALKAEQEEIAAKLEAANSPAPLKLHPTAIAPTSPD